MSLSSKKQYIVLSAIHLLGPAGGLNQDVATRNIDKIVTELTLKPCFGNAKPLTIQAESLPIHDASPELQPAGPGDIIAFWAPRSDSIEALSLASDTPRPGTRVWLAASVMEGASPSQRVHGATVTNRDTFGLLFYEFDIADLSLEATSGAPVLDANGHVVAIHLARVSDGGRFLGAGNPVGRFGPYLVSAAERSAVD